MDQAQVSQRRRLLITAAMMVGMLIAGLDQTIVDTAFPKMISQLGGVSYFTWVITAYLLTSTSVVPVVDKLSDLYGRKLFWNLGISLFVGASVLCGTATSMTQLIIYRAIQGLGGGMIMPISQTIIGDIYTGEQRAKMQGVFSGVWGLASAIGPLVGGFIVDHWHWRYIFLLNLPTGLLALALSARALTGGATNLGRKIDWAGSFLSIVGVSALLMALQTGGNEWAWNSWQSLSLFAGSALFLTLFVINEVRAPEPILDLRLLGNRVFATFSVVSFVLGCGMFGAIVFFPWFIQGVVGVSATRSGTIMVPMTLSMVLGSFLGGQLARRIAYRWQVSGGLAIVATGFALAGRFSPATTVWQARGTIMVLGFGMGLVMPLITLGVQQAFGRQLRGVVTSTTAFFRSVGAVVGVTVFGLIFNREMTAQYNLHLAPRLAAAPPQLAAKFHEFAAKPSNLVQLLLQKQLQQFIPAPVRAMVLDTIKTMMSAAIHPVFRTSLLVILTAIAIAQFLGRESLSRQIARQAERGVAELADTEGPEGALEMAGLME
ncbi:MAG: MDR family MFS transporter [Chitinophagales bacterium]